MKISHCSLKFKFKEVQFPRYPLKGHHKFWSEVYELLCGIQVNLLMNVIFKIEASYDIVSHCAPSREAVNTKFKVFDTTRNEIGEIICSFRVMLDTNSDSKAANCSFSSFRYNLTEDRTSAKRLRSRLFNQYRLVNCYLFASEFTSRMSATIESLFFLPMARNGWAIF